jgi:hypothetical protein
MLGQRLATRGLLARVRLDLLLGRRCIDGGVELCALALVECYRAPSLMEGRAS